MISQAIVLILALQTLFLISVSMYSTNWIVRFIVLGYLTVLASASYFVFDGVKGWPAEEPVTVKGSLASVVIVNPSSEDKGGIYIGVFMTDEKKWWEYDYSRIAPKTFYVEYSNNRAAEFEKAKQALKDGKEVRINGIPPKDAPEGSGEASDGDPSDIGIMMQNMFDRLLSKQKDTYKPNTPKDNLEIIEQGAPPPKGSEP